MTVTATPIFPQALVNAIGTVTAAETQTYETVITAGTNGTKIESLSATSTDTSARDITLNITISSTNYQISQIQIPITAGLTNSAPCVNLLTHIQMASILPLDSNGNPYLYLASGSSLTINAPVTITAAKQIQVIALGVNF